MTYQRIQYYAREEGREEGRREAAIENAKNLLAMNILTQEQIAKGTGLPLEKIKELAEEIK